MLFTKLRSLKA